jgi:hypothetical protein
MVRYNASAGANANKDTKMVVDFETKCVTPPQHMAEKFKNELSMANNKNSTSYTTGEGTKSNALNGRCFKTAACGAGQYPQVIITTHPVGPIVLPSYPRYNLSTNTAKFPDLDQVKGVALGVVGAVLCGEGTAAAKSDRLTLEASYMNSEGQMRIEKREVSIPRNNVANIQMLPNNDPLAPSLP